MEFYNVEENAKKYIEMAKGFDGRELIEILKEFVPEGASVLELGIGPGLDLKILNAYYKVTGSDTSKYFRERLSKMHPQIKIIELDAKNININQKFDCIYSNKVLIHLTDEEIEH